MKGDRFGVAAEHHHPQLTPEVKDKIFGANAARIFEIDIAAARQAIEGDLLYKLRDDRKSARARMPDARGSRFILRKVNLRGDRWAAEKIWLGTDGSNPSPSSGESGANSIS